MDVSSRRLRSHAKEPIVAKPMVMGNGDRDGDGADDPDDIEIPSDALYGEWP